MKKLLVLLFVSLAVSACAGVVFMGADGQPVDVSAANPLPTSGNTTVSISTITAELATGANTIGKVKLTPYTTASYTNITLTPNVAYSIPLMTGVDSMTIQNTATSGEFWTGLKTATVSISTGLKAFSLVNLEHVDFDAISIIASTALPIAITQQGY